jgi:hypothetical protein
MIKRRWIFMLGGVGIFVSPGIVEPAQRAEALTLLANTNEIFAATVCHDTPARRGPEACSAEVAREHGWPEFRNTPRLADHQGVLGAAPTERTVRLLADPLAVTPR